NHFRKGSARGWQSSGMRCALHWRSLASRLRQPRMLQVPSYFLHCTGDPSVLTGPDGPSPSQESSARTTFITRGPPPADFGRPRMTVTPGTPSLTENPLAPSGLWPSPRLTLVSFMWAREKDSSAKTFPLEMEFTNPQMAAKPGNRSDSV